MFRHSLNILRPTPQTVFSALKHTGNTKQVSKIALTTRLVNDADGKPSIGSLNGNIGPTSIASKSTLLIPISSQISSLVFYIYCLISFFISTVANAATPAMGKVCFRTNTILDHVMFTLYAVSIFVLYAGLFKPSCYRGQTPGGDRRY